MAEVQCAGDVRRRNDDSERLTVSVDLGIEATILLPARVDFTAGGLVVKAVRYFGCCFVHDLVPFPLGNFPSSKSNLYSTASTSASQLASMIFSLTPMVPHT